MHSIVKPINSNLHCFHYYSRNAGQARSPSVSVSYLSTEYKPTEPGAIMRQLKLQKVIMKIALHLIKRSAYNYHFPCVRAVCIFPRSPPDLRWFGGWFSSAHKQLANKYTYSFYCPNDGGDGGGDWCRWLTMPKRSICRTDWRRFVCTRRYYLHTFIRLI